MIVTDLAQMEDIVSHNADLEWDGWDVVAYVKKTSFFNPLARRRNGEWWETKTYHLGTEGWKVPRSFYAAVEG